MPSPTISTSHVAQDEVDDLKRDVAAEPVLDAIDATEREAGASDGAA